MKPPPTRKSSETGSVTSRGILVAFWNWWDSFSVKTSFFFSCCCCSVCGLQHAQRTCQQSQRCFFLSPHPSGIMCPRPPITATIITIKAQWPGYNQQTALDLQLVVSRNKLLHLRATASLNLLPSSASVTFRLFYFLYLEITLTLQVCYFSEAYRLGLRLTFFFNWTSIQKVDDI